MERQTRKQCIAVSLRNKNWGVETAGTENAGRENGKQ